jgi:hypothetical protein
MIKRINQSEFIDWFKKSDIYKNNFSYYGLVALFDYLEEYEETTGEEIEFDPIALCCEYTEFDSFADLQAQYPNIKDFEELNDKTTVIPVDNAMKTENFIIANF